MQHRTRYATIAVTFTAAYLRDVRNLQARFFPGLFLVMLAIANIDLNTDPAAVAFVKDEVVEVVFAKTDGQLVSREGVNRFQAGDALITGSTGDRWSVSRDRFHARYDPVPPAMAGDDGKYRSKPVPVLARQISEPFTLSRTKGGDLLRGLAQDWLLQYAPGDYGIVENVRFRQVYRRCER